MTNDISGIHAYLVERYPMYRTDVSFEEWLLGKSGGERERMTEYLLLLEDYGFIDGEGRIGKDFNTIPDPAGVVADIEARLGRLDPETLNVLKGAAVEGPEFSTDGATAIAGTDIGNGLAAAEQAGLVRRIGEENIYARPTTRYRFRPQKVQDLIYAALSEDERSRLHGLFVEFLTEQLQRTTEQGSREMLSSLISEHNRRTMRPEPKESPKSPDDTKANEIRS